MIASISDLQRRLGVDSDGIAGPLTARAMEVAFSESDILARCTGNGETLDCKILGVKMGEPGDWMAEAKSMLGKHERRNNRTLMDWLRKDGASIGDPARTPWCGDFTQTALRVTGHSVELENPYMARNWLNFGERCTPKFGAVLVFWRGSAAGWQGHVGFYMAEDPTHFHVLGGNQRNSVSVARLAKHRLLGARWPKTASGYTPRKFTIAPGATTTNES